MNLEDRAALEWMARFTRNPMPGRVVWKQSSVTHDRLYWLALPEGQAKAGQLVIASRKGQDIEIEKAENVTRLTILLNDAMLDLDRPITLRMSGRQLFHGVAPRTIETLHSTLDQRGDPFLAFNASVTVDLPNES